MRGCTFVVFLVVLGAGLVAAPQGASAQAGPTFTEQVLEMTPATLDRFAKALALEESSRKSIAAKAAAPLPKAKKTKDEYAACQMELYMTPEFQQMMQGMTSAVTGGGKDPAAVQKSVQEAQGRMEAFVEKSCGPDPSKTFTKPDVGSLLRQAQADAARSTGFTGRQYAIIKERVTPLCLSDPTPPGPDGLKIRGEGSVLFVYTTGEVEALRPRCEAFTKLLVVEKQ